MTIRHFCLLEYDGGYLILFMLYIFRCVIRLICRDV